MNSFDWNQFYNSFKDTRDAEKAKREQQDAADRDQINTLVGNVEKDVMKSAEKGRDAKRADLDVRNATSFNQAKEAFKSQNAMNPQVQKSQWESGLQLGRQQGEAASPWDSLGSRLVGVQQNVNRVNNQTRQNQQAAALKQAQEDFNKRSREIMANDTARKNPAAAGNAAFSAAVAKYGQLADEQKKQGKKLVVEPYAQAMEDCRNGTGPCPPDMTQQTGVASSMDPNNLSPDGKVALTRAQEELRKRLDAIRDDESFSYGTNSDSVAWF